MAGSNVTLTSRWSRQAQPKVTDPEAWNQEWIELQRNPELKIARQLLSAKPAGSAAVELTPERQRLVDREKEMMQERQIPKAIGHAVFGDPRYVPVDAREIAASGDPALMNQWLHEVRALPTSAWRAAFDDPGHPMAGVIREGIAHVVNALDQLGVNPEK